MKTKIFALLLGVFSFCQTIFCQIVNGRIINETGSPVASVSIKNLHNPNATISDVNGRFSIKIEKLPDTLLFNAVGFEPYKVAISEKNINDPKFEVVLLQNRHELDEVVVTGYGTSARRDMTGSISSFPDKSYSLKKAYVGEALSGRVAGVSVGKSKSRIGFASGKKISFNDTLYKSSKNPSSKLITAGEVNDFNKWKMWEDFAENDFKTYSQQWHLFFTKRLCVQLQNSNHKPVIGQSVFLLNANNLDTIWKSQTDNTGKAELWVSANTLQPAENATYLIATKGHENIDHPYFFEQGINQITLGIDCNTSNSVEIAFMVDATGSMGDEIEFLKLELEDVLQNTANKFSDLNLRAASVFYRDHGDEYLTKQIGFNTDFLKVMNFIKMQRASGGGDTPEAVEIALNAALDSLDWNENARTKLLFLVLDAPPHNGTETEMFRLIKKAAAKGVRIIPIVCSGADKSTEFLMRSIALATNGTYVFLTDDSGVGAEHLKPTTDVFTVELLNNLLQRLINQYIYAPTCNATNTQTLATSTFTGNILNVKISPNPTTGHIFIKSSKRLKEIFVADFTGKILQRLTANEKQEKWDVELGAYPAGVYLIKYITQDNELGAEKIILTH